MKGKIITILLILSPNTLSYAGFNGLTHHSRANCLTLNESVSWDARGRYRLQVNSIHTDKNKKWHEVHDPVKRPNYDLKWRFAAYHIGEAFSGWTVEGYHYSFNPRNNAWNLDAKETVTDCSIYNGWWKKDHPERESLNNKENI